MKAYEKHGMRYEPEYQVWASIVKRCYDEGSSQYKDYGERGILMSHDWRHNFSSFIRDMGPRPDGATIERRDVNKGYDCYNCYWELDRSVQAYNTRLRSNNTSGKAGVMWNTDKEKWEAYIYQNKKRKRLGFFTDKDEAISAREASEIELYGKLKGV